MYNNETTSKILIVDDQEYNIALLERRLRAENRVILTANSGRKAIEILKVEEDIALILLDIQMPELDGFETIKLIKQNEDWRYIPVIFITGIYYTEEFLDLGFNLGAYDYMTKPIDNNVLMNKVNVFLSLYHNRKLLINKSKELTESNRRLQTISQCNYALLHATDEMELLTEICDILVKTAGYEFAYISKVKIKNSIIEEIKPFTFSEVTIDYSELFCTNIFNFESNDCTIKDTVTTELLIVSKHDIKCKKCFEALEHLGLEYCIYIPLQVKDITDWMMFVFSKSKSKIIDEEIEFLKSINEYINYGLYSLDTRKLKRKAEEALQIEKEELSISLRSIRDGIITVTKTGDIHYANDSACEILSLEMNELLGKQIFEAITIVKDDDSEAMFNPFDWVQSQRVVDVQKRQYVIITKAGDKKIISVSLNEIKDSNNNFNGLVLVFSDITDLVRIENQQALSQKMESIGLLASGIAHEINSPMQYVSDNTYFLKSSFKDILSFISEVNSMVDNHLSDKVFDSFTKELKKKKKKYDIEFLMQEIPLSIDRTLSGIERVSKIVSAMKNFAHPSGKQKTLADINKGIEVTATISKNEWKYIADMELKLEPNLPMILCCLDEINQVMLNLIINSAHAIEEKIGRNSGEKGFIKIETLLENDYIVINITDSGNGIPKEIQSRVFDPFFTTKEIGKGTGQGLAISHDIIVNKHKGQIYFNSKKGVGTTFTIKLPNISE